MDFFSSLILTMPPKPMPPKPMPPTAEHLRFDAIWTILKHSKVAHLREAL